MTGENTWTQKTDVVYNVEYNPATDQIKWWHNDKNKYLLFSKVNEAFTQIPEGCTEQLNAGGYQYCTNYKSGTTSYVATLNECIAQCTDCEYYTKYANDAPEGFSKDGKGRCILQAEGKCGKLIKYEDKKGYKAKTFYCPGKTATLPPTTTTATTTNAAAITYASPGCSSVELPGASEVKLSESGKSCAESFGDSWAAASFAQVQEWCGCSEADAKCLCQSKLSPFKLGQWQIVGLEDGQAMGTGYKHEVKYSGPGQAAQQAIDLCYECKGSPAPAPPLTTTGCSSVELPGASG